jgi:hypothetical protein
MFKKAIGNHCHDIRSSRQGAWIATTDITVSQ